MQAENCGSCAIPGDRRKFLREAGLAVASVLVATRRTALSCRRSLEFVAAERKGGKLTYPIPAADGAQIDRDNELVLVRWQNVLYAFSIDCPHQSTILRWDEADFALPLSQASLPVPAPTDRSSRDAPPAEWIGWRCSAWGTASSSIQIVCTRKTPTPPSGMRRR